MSLADERRRRNAHLQRGNQLRAQVSALKGYLARDDADWDGLLRGNGHADPVTLPAWDGRSVDLVPADVVRAMRLRDVLQAIRGIGPRTTTEITEALGFDDPLTPVRVRDLSYEARCRCADLVDQSLRFV